MEQSLLDTRIAQLHIQKKTGQIYQLKIFTHIKNPKLCQKWQLGTLFKKEGNGLELAAVNPVGVMGPVLSAKYSHSNVQIQEMLEGKIRALPNVDSGYVDVRDVASLHILAMTSPKANGERFLCKSIIPRGIIKLTSLPDINIKQTKNKARRVLKQYRILARITGRSLTNIKSPVLNGIPKSNDFNSIQETKNIQVINAQM